MFDRLIESNTAAVVKTRRNYFMVSSIVVGTLFLTAVVLSLYAESIDLGVDEFDSATLLAPVATEAPAPPEPATPNSHRKRPRRTFRTATRTCFDPTKPRSTLRAYRPRQIPNYRDRTDISTSATASRPIISAAAV